MMGFPLAKLVFIVFLAQINKLDSKPVEVIYNGEGCDCLKTLPYQLNIPVPPPTPVVNCQTHGYKVEIPPPPAVAPPEPMVSYSFDFHVEEPLPPPPKPVCKQSLFATVDKIVIPKADCLDVIAPPAPPLPLPPPPPPPAVFKPCPYDNTKPCTCGAHAAPKLVVDYGLLYPQVLPAPAALPAPVKSCACGQCDPLNPQCRYVYTGFPSNRIARSEGRSKRDVSSKKQDYLTELRSYVKSLKSARVARKAKKSKIVKRDIKGEYDLLQKDQAALDLTLPEIIQYMPETLMPNFQRGKCNIGCKNCVSKHQEESEKNVSPPELANSEQNDKLSDNEQQESKQPAKSPIENAKTLSHKQFRPSPRFGGMSSYLKRSVNQCQYPYPCYPALMPPPYMPSPLHLATLAQNPGNPIWYQPRPLIDPNGHYVYDRLGHKYEVKNGSLKLVAPDTKDEVNVSAPAVSPPADKEETEQSSQPTGTAVAADQAQAKAHEAANNGQMLQEPIVGAPVPLGSSYDPQMDKVIRDIIYQHPDFIDATQHAPGSLTQPQEVQTDETMQFLDKLIRGRLNNWFGINEDVPHQNLHDLNRYSRETGTSVKFIPVVTVDKDKLNKYRREKAHSAK